MPARGFFTPSLQDEHINIKELVAVHLALRSYAHLFPAGAVLDVRTDSRVTMGVLNAMCSRSRCLMAEVRRLHFTISALRVRVRASWLPVRAPTRVRRSLTNHLTEEHTCPAVFRDGRDQTVPQRPLRNGSQLIWVLFLMIICHPSAGHAILIMAQSWLGLCEENPLGCYWLAPQTAEKLTVSMSVAILQ